MSWYDVADICLIILTIAGTLVCLSFCALFITLALYPVFDFLGVPRKLRKLRTYLKERLKCLPRH